MENDARFFTEIKLLIEELDNANLHRDSCVCTLLVDDVRT